MAREVSRIAFPPHRPHIAGMLTDRILFIDAEAIVLDKPAGLPVTPVRDPNVLSVENHLDSLRMGFQRQPAAVHRLDRDTSGCLLLARNPKAQKRFSLAFEEGAVEKVYLAVLDGVPAEQEGLIDLPLHKVSTREEGWRMIVHKRGKPSRTSWRVMAEASGRALVRFRLLTGRTHQIRVHAASGLQLPVAGDPVYGAGRGSMLLHAWKLRLDRGSKPLIEATAPLPPTFAAAGFTDAAVVPSDAEG
jgi:tRNA pseudouridine32 synthase/23S rRNA pseudouridine746 synthase